MNSSYGIYLAGNQVQHNLSKNHLANINRQQSAKNRFVWSRPSSTKNVKVRVTQSVINGHKSDRTARSLKLKRRGTPETPSFGVFDRSVYCLKVVSDWFIPTWKLYSTFLFWWCVYGICIRPVEYRQTELLCGGLITDILTFSRHCGWSSPNCPPHKTLKPLFVKLKTGVFSKKNQLLQCRKPSSWRHIDLKCRRQHNWLLSMYDNHFVLPVYLLS